MLCERCKKNEANYYYHESVNGAEKTYHLCAECAKELEKSGEIKNFAKDNFMDSFFTKELDSMNSVFSSLFSPAYSQGKLKNPERTKCSLCGATFDELARDGKTGCPKCYEVFADELDASIRRIHGRSSHTGRAPFKFREKNETKQKLHQLEKDLKEEIRNENYERAAELRDEIKALRAADEGNNN